MATSDCTNGWFPSEEDELVQRLRGLEWPEIGSDVRRRCWQEFSERIARGGAGELAAGATVATRDVSDRYECTRRSPSSESFVTGQRRAAAGAASRSWSRSQGLRRALSFA
jgi:hypothetical protein